MWSHAESSSSRTQHTPISTHKANTIYWGQTLQESSPFFRLPPSKSNNPDIMLFTTNKTKFMKHLLFTFALAASGFLNCQAATVSKTPLPNKLWYNKPAYAFEESLPLGNGKLGALVYGGANNDSIQLNDITLWTGVPVNPDEGGEAYKWIPKIREALFKEDYKTADSLQHYVQGHNSEFYQPLGMINIIDCNQGEFTDYYRELSLDNSLATVHFKRNGIQYTKEYFASHPDKMIAIKLSASQKRAINSDISLTSLIPHQVKASKGQLTMTGHVLGDEANSTHYCAMLQVKNTDGQVWADDSVLHLKDVSEAIIYLVNETSYNGFDKHPVKEGAPYIERVSDDAWHLANFTYDEFKQRHIADYRKLFDRVSLNLKGAKLMLPALLTSSCSPIATTTKTTLIWNSSISNMADTCSSAVAAPKGYQPICRDSGHQPSVLHGVATIPSTSIWKRITGQQKLPISQNWLLL